MSQFCIHVHNYVQLLHTVFKCQTTMTNGQIVIRYTHRDLWPTGRSSSDDNDQRADCHLIHT